MNAIDRIISRLNLTALITRQTASMILVLAKTSDGRFCICNDRDVVRVVGNDKMAALSEFRRVIEA